MENLQLGTEWDKTFPFNKIIFTGLMQGNGKLFWKLSNLQ